MNLGELVEKFAHEYSETGRAPLIRLPVVFPFATTLQLENITSTLTYLRTSTDEIHRHARTGKKKAYVSFNGDSSCIVQVDAGDYMVDSFDSRNWHTVLATLSLLWQLREEIMKVVRDRSSSETMGSYYREFALMFERFMADPIGTMVETELKK